MRFREERRWGVYHNPKDLALALSVEAGELLEVFLWKSGEEADLGRVKEELADVLAYALLLADRCNLDVRQIVLDKIAQNALKYPVDKAAGMPANTPTCDCLPLHQRRVYQRCGRLKLIRARV